MPLPTPLDLAKRLIATPSPNPPGEEQACADFMASHLAEAGFSLTWRDLAPGRPNLIARLGHGPCLAFSGHLDTVPLGGQEWSRYPFEGQVEGGRLYGRGASDMKSGLAAMLHAAMRLAGHARGGGRSIMLLLTAGEEKGCQGAQSLIREPELLADVAALVIGEPSGNQPCLGHKGGLWAKAHFQGKAAHASMPHLGRSAIYAAARAALTLERHDFGVTHPLLGSPTINVGRISGGTADNIVPDHCTMGLDIRLLPGMDPHQVLADLQKALGDECALEMGNYMAPVWSDRDDPWVGRALGVCARVDGQQPGGLAYVTDASVLAAPLGAPVLVLGPGEAGQAHQTDEFCLIDRLEQAAEIYYQLAMDWLEDS